MAEDARKDVDGDPEVFESMDQGYIVGILIPRLT
jgi:hypothetical protein